MVLLAQSAHAGIVCGAGGLCTQTIALNPGWNAVYVKLDPDDTAIAEVLADLVDGDGPQVASVWTWLPHRARVDFILDPETESLLSEPGWLRFFHPQSDEAFLSTLYAVTANRAYLVRVEGTEPVDLEITGRPVPPRTRWVPDSLNLLGFHVDEANPPTFLDFFSPSPAHDGSPVYRLDSASGAWQAVDPATELMAPDAAYWVYSHGGSDYTGPVALERGRRLDFGQDIETLGLRVRNLRTDALNVELNVVANHEPVQIANPLPDATIPWLPLADIGPQQVEAGSRLRLILGLRRAGLSGSDYGEVLEIRVPGILRYLIVVTAGSNGLTATDPSPVAERFAGLSREASGAAEYGSSPLGDGRRHDNGLSLPDRLLNWLIPPAAAQADYSGLWVGVVEIDRVSQVNNYQHDCVPDPSAVETIPDPDGLFAPVYIGIDPGTGTDLCTDPGGVPTLLDTAALAPVEPAFQFRIILHQDGAGNVNLLKDVIQMWENGESEADGTVITPGRYVLLVDDSLVPFFEGTQLRDGETVGARVSTAAYDYDSDRQPMTGALGTSLDTVMSLAQDAATNPFRHLYHARHQSGFPITRAMSLVFDGDTSMELGDGYSVLAGSFEETVTGLHQYPIISAGTFELRRLSEVAELTTEVDP